MHALSFWHQKKFSRQILYGKNVVRSNVMAHNSSLKRCLAENVVVLTWVLISKNLQNFNFIKICEIFKYKFKKILFLFNHWSKDIINIFLSSLCLSLSLSFSLSLSLYLFFSLSQMCLWEVNLAEQLPLSLEPKL
jgi:hypothetical protein